jgi:hypothetical protein
MFPRLAHYLWFRGAGWDNASDQGDPPPDRSGVSPWAAKSDLDAA